MAPFNLFIETIPAGEYVDDTDSETKTTQVAISRYFNPIVETGKRRKSSDKSSKEKKTKKPSGPKKKTPKPPPKSVLKNQRTILASIKPTPKSAESH
jgi:hypothetical protein